MEKYQGKVMPGKPYPLGSTWDGNGVNFALFSRNAASVKLCLFNDHNHNEEYTQISLSEVTDNVWHVYLPGIMPGQQYGYRVYGSFRPSAGFRFNPHKLLIDPYAKAISPPIEINDNNFGFPVNINDKNTDLKKDVSNSAAVTGKSIVINSNFNWEGVILPDIPLHKSIIYELHVKGFTALHPHIPEHERGSYKALTYPFIIDYFKNLGITAIELMPIHHFVNNKFLQDRGLVNYWGYNSIGFFAPHAAYASTGRYGEQVNEFKEMVKTYHKNGIEVILDVVYNHTGEGDHFGPTLNFRGIDNPVYYKLNEKHKRHYTDYTGTGNTLNVANARVLQLVMDSLRYWATEMQVDGFRFDLAPALTRGNYEINRVSSFLDTIHQDPVISQRKLLAEPWDLGEGGYMVGNFPVLWAEWNGKYRDAIRKFWHGASDARINELANRLTGSGDLYHINGKQPSASINFITSHDGFTLLDLVSYNTKHNELNFEDNKDGENHNISWNCGIEGPTDDEGINLLRRKQMRNFLATLFFSQGVPMISHGDEYGKTQNGNNNVYCQDNTTSWLRWDWSETEKRFFEFVRTTINLRKGHPVFHKRRYFEGRRIRGKDVKDIRWINPDGTEISVAEWNMGLAKCLGMLLNGRLMNEIDEEGNIVKDDIFFVIMNNQGEPVQFTLPPDDLSYEWELITDTSFEDTVPQGVVRSVYEVKERSLVLLKNSVH